MNKAFREEAYEWLTTTNRKLLEVRRQEDNRRFAFGLAMAGDTAVGEKFSGYVMDIMNGIMVFRIPLLSLGSANQADFVLAAEAIDEHIRTFNK